ncbi:putative tyrosine recombinase XerC-like protein [Thermoplasmatales archaeon]|nr:putative tyrosine recombinase XerC-like protein [Thermoplasmatales archaeon]
MCPSPKHQHTQSLSTVKNEKYREVPLFPSVKDAFQKYLTFRQALIEKTNKNTRSLMVTQYGKPVTDIGGHNIIDRIAKRAGIPFSPHRARRFYGGYLWENGLKPELIQQLLGHESVGTTMIFIQADAEDAFSEVRKYMKKLDFRVPQGKVVKEMVCYNLNYIVCSGRALDTMMHFSDEHHVTPG